MRDPTTLRDLTILDGSGERYRIVAIDVKQLLQSVDHPERTPTWVNLHEMTELHQHQDAIRAHAQTRTRTQEREHDDG